eukprot:scaffold43030_cov59-Phaeocystis_antarctica.AAC.4
MKTPGGEGGRKGGGGDSGGTAATPVEITTLSLPPSSAEYTKTYTFMDADSSPVSSWMYCPSEHPASSHVSVSGLQSVSTVLPYRPVCPEVGDTSVQWMRSTGVSYRCSMTKYLFPLLLECVVWSSMTAEVDESSVAASDRCNRKVQLGSHDV